MNSQNKFCFFASLLTATTFTIVFGLVGLGLFFWEHLDDAVKAVLIQVVGDNFYVLSASLILLLGGWIGWTYSAINLYILPTIKIADEILLIQSANLSHRIEIQAGKDVNRLVNLINEGADHYENLKRSIDEKIRLAGEELEQEKNILASIIAGLSEGIIVCKPSGSIFLYNTKAEKFLTYREKSTTNLDIETLTGQFIGLGRNVSCVFNSFQINRAIAEITEKLTHSDKDPGTCFSTLGPYGHFLRVEIVPILRNQLDLVGFILKINDITQTSPQKSISRYDDASTALNIPLASKQEYCPSCCEIPLVPSQIQNILEIVQNNVAKENILLKLNLQEEPVWVYTDVNYMNSALSYLLSRLSILTGSSIFDCDVEIERDYVKIDIIWVGSPVSDNVLDEWNQCILSNGNGIEAISLQDIILSHEAELWSSVVHKSPERACLRFFLPSAEPSRARSIETVTITSSRPEFYDFNLFDRPETSTVFYKQLLTDITYTVFDTETTGLFPLTDEIISIGAVRIVNGRILKNDIFNIFIDPKRDIPEESIKIHGIRPEMVHGQPTIDKVLPMFHHFAENTVMVGHNAAFDMRMFQIKEYVSGIKFRQPVLDTLFLSAVIHPSYTHHNLEAISERLGITISGRHTALGDAVAAAEIFLKCIPLLARKGILTLGDALDASRKTRYAGITY